MNISLIGMPASGKTTISKALKEKLTNYILIDTDEIIVDNEKRSILEIFNTNGEDYFREVETKVLKDILKKDNQIISTGGGIVKTRDNVELLKKGSVVIYLETSIDSLESRAIQSTERPLLQLQDIKEKMEQLLNERENQYKKAHYVVKTDNKSIDEIVMEIINKINEHS